MSQWDHLFRKVGRGPFKPNGSVCVELGRVEVVELGREVEIRMRKPSRPKLYWCPERKALMFFAGRNDNGRGSSRALDALLETPEGRGAAKLFERWSQREAGGARTFETKMTDRWVATKMAPTRIDYWSDKWGDRASYTHDLGKKVRAWLLLGSSNPLGSALWILRGGSLTVTERGIVG